MKNQQLVSEVASWQTAFNMQVTSQTDLVASSITVPQMQPAMPPQMSGPQMIPLEGQTEIHTNVVQTSMSMQREPSFAEQTQRQRHVSFGSVFDASFGQNGGQNNGENLNEWGEPQDDSTVQMQQNIALFKLEIKPKDPPMFYGRAAEDVSMWISKVSDFFYLTGATDC